MCNVACKIGRLQHWINLLSLKEIGIGTGLWYPLQWICPD